MSDAPAKRKAQKTFHEPIKYEIGRDVSQAQYEELCVKVADWFREWRPNQSEPAADARMRIRCCLDGKTLDGQPWYSHWQSTFATRMRMLCRFDVDKMAPIRTGDEKKKQQKERAKDRETARRLAGTGANDPHIPEIRRKELDGRINWGDVAKPITDGEKGLWDDYRDAYLEQFPELRTVNAKGELSMLCDLQVVHERNRLKLLSGEKIDPVILTDTLKLITDLKKALGIHPDQLAKRVREEQGGSVADAAARLANMPKELRDKFWLEEMLVLFQMFVTPSPRSDTDGYQIDEIGLFGQTRCRTCHCAKCNHKNFVGISIDEITAFLIEKGVLEAIENPVDRLLAAGAAAESNGAEGADGGGDLGGGA